MKINFMKRIPLILLLAFAAIPNARADFEDMGWGARPMGMGGAFVGLADDSRAVFYNPAGLAYIRRTELSGDYARLHGGLKDQSTLSSSLFSLAVPIKIRKSHEERVRNLSRLAKEEEEKKETKTGKPRGKDKDRKITFFRDMGTVSLALTNFSFDGVLSENTVWLGYAREVRERLSAGLNLKLMKQDYTLDNYTKTDPVFGRGSKNSLSVYGADAGLLYNLSPKTFIGLAASNINSPSVSLGSAGKETLPLTLKTGLAHKHNKLNTAVDAIMKDNEYRLYAGGERWFSRQTFAVRFGGGFGARDYKNVAAGFSVNWNSIQLDYAITLPVSGVKKTYGSHKLSLVYRFGKEPDHDLMVGSLEFYYSRLLDETEVLRSSLEKAEDERSRLEKVLVEEAMSRIKEKVRAEKLEVTVEQNRKGAAAPSPSAQMLRPLMVGDSGGGGFKTYVTLKGDTLQSIAEQFYGKKDRWTEILNMNKEKVGRGGSLKSGTVLFIPGVGGVESIAPSAAQETLAPLGAREPLASPSANPQTLTPLKPLQPLKPKEEKKDDKGAVQPKTFTVEKGDTLSSIAQKVYGDSKRWKEIFNANKDKIDRGAVAPGTVLSIP